MPNWVKNNLRIKSNGERILEALEMLKDKNGDITFEKFMPTPKELADTDAPNRDASYAERKQLIEKYGADNWYDWRIKNWGCKWDASESDTYIYDGDQMITFQTPWGPPDKFLIEFSKLFPKMTFILQFADESGGNPIGQLTFNNGKEEYVEPEDRSAFYDVAWGEDWWD